MTNTQDKALAKVGTTFAETVERILAVWEKATPTNIEEGSQWYALNGQAIIEIAHGTGHNVDTVAAVVAHLSPRIHWVRNLALAANVLSGGSTKGIMNQSLKNAQRALDSDEPLSTLNGNKVKAFAANLLGDTEAVTVDVWALRVAGVDEAKIGLKGVYDAIADAYREAARRIGVEPSTMQAVTWVIARNGRAD